MGRGRASMATIARLLGSVPRGMWMSSSLASGFLVEIGLPAPRGVGAASGRGGDIADDAPSHHRPGGRAGLHGVAELAGRGRGRTPTPARAGGRRRRSSGACRGTGGAGPGSTSRERKARRATGRLRTSSVVTSTSTSSPGPVPSARGRGDRHPKLALDLQDQSAPSWNDRPRPSGPRRACNPDTAADPGSQAIGLVPSATSTTR